MAAFVEAYRTKGYEVCADGALESGIEKVALYATVMGPIQSPTHAALQLQNGKWSSKLGDFEDIEHDTPEVLHSPLYGVAIIFMSRRRSKLPRKGRARPRT